MRPTPELRRSSWAHSRSCWKIPISSCRCPVFCPRCEIPTPGLDLSLSSVACCVPKLSWIPVVCWFDSQCLAGSSPVLSGQTKRKALKAEEDEVFREQEDALSAGAGRDFFTSFRRLMSQKKGYLNWQICSATCLWIWVAGWVFYRANDPKKAPPSPDFRMESLESCASTRRLASWPCVKPPF